ncbi:MAG TPA: Gfo/Idh/MocA family oxidoreductase [Gemmataceae bacterium]|nr:Gfo/Idh/MocA family oxidoreductase [Gemmataceae bacterium]
MAMRVAIIGCGLIGHKRAGALPADVKLVAVADASHPRAQHLANAFSGCEVEPDWQSCIARRDTDAVIVSTVNDALAAVTLAAVRKGKHVLVEKPAARHADELRPVRDAARAAGVVVKVGFNHRFHPAFVKARQLCDAGELGPLLYVRGRYGHGGRLGYDREWRADPAVAGGGELLDQGVHLIDLSRWFLGDFVDVWGQTATYFWDMPVEDNGFLALRTSRGQTAWLHASCTEWKNLFSFELFGRDGKVQIDGLGGSYGVERLSFYRTLPQMGPPETTIWEYPGDDLSWRAELAHFRDCIEANRQPMGTLEDAIAALEIVEGVYRQTTIHLSQTQMEPKMRKAI